MVTTQGSAETGNAYPGAGPLLPRPPAGLRPAHRPWCVDCKRTVDADELDTTGRCTRCGPTAAARAEAAERRRAADEADAKAARSRPTKPTTTATTACAPRRSSRLLDQHRAQVIRSYQDGDTSAVIADTYGVSPATVINYLRTQGVTVRGRGGHPKTGATS